MRVRGRATNGLLNFVMPLGRGRQLNNRVKPALKCDGGSLVQDPGAIGSDHSLRDVDQRIGIKAVGNNPVDLRNDAGDHMWEQEQFFIELGKLRAVFGQQLALLGYLYGVDIEESLAAILPPEAS